MSDATVLQVRGLRKSFARSTRGALRYGAEDIARAVTGLRRTADHLRHGEFWALRDISFSLRRGESIGILGRNGAGKSTLLKLVSGIYEPTGGTIDIRGRTGAIIELGAAFAGNLTGRENIRPQALLSGYDEARLRRRTDDIIAFADLGDFIDAPVQHYSTGMRARLGFAIAACSEPDLLLVDEALSVGDLSFQNKCLAFINAFRERGGAVVFVGHSTHQMQAVCERGIVLHEGVVEFEGGMVEAIDAYMSSDRAAAPGGSAAASATGKSVTMQRIGPCRVAVETSGPSDMPRARVRWEVQLAEAIPDLRLAIGVASQRDGVQVAAGVTPPFAIGAGRQVLTLDLPSLPLIAGSYLARLSALTGEPPYPLWTLGWEDAPVAFEIPGAATAVANLFEAVGTHVRLDVRRVADGQWE